MGILYVAAYVSEERVDLALKRLIADSESICADRVNVLLVDGDEPEPATEIHIAAVDLKSYDRLLGEEFDKEGARCVQTAI